MATEPEDARLDALFAAAREAETPGDDLVARVLADAAMVQAAARPAPAPSPAPVQRGGVWAGILSALGGWPGLSGVTAAGVAGLVIGLWAPDVVDSLSGGQLWLLTGGGGTMPEMGMLWAEAGDV
jgi:hypothetical protein